MSDTTLDTPSIDPRHAMLIGVEQRLVKAQAVAGTLFSTFVLMHLSNIVMAPLGADLFNQYQAVLRIFYQNPVIELGIVIVPLLIHAYAGIRLFFIRRGRRVRHNWRRRIQGWAGAFLLFVIVGHVAATRGASFFYGVFPGFEGLSFSLWWIPTYFYPYYLLLGSFGFYHATNGLMTLARRRGLGVPWQAQVTASVIMTALVGLALLSMGGAFFDIANPVDNDYARLFEQLFGIELQ